MSPARTSYLLWSHGYNLVQEAKEKKKRATAWWPILLFMELLQGLQIAIQPPDRQKLKPIPVVNVVIPRVNLPPPGRLNNNLLKEREDQTLSNWWSGQQESLWIGRIYMAWKWPPIKEKRETQKEAWWLYTGRRYTRDALDPWEDPNCEATSNLIEVFTLIICIDALALFLNSSEGESPPPSFRFT